MKKAEFTALILKTFAFPPTEDQLAAVEAFSTFMFTSSQMSAMVLCGSAGTGKTSLAAAMMRTLRMLGQKIVLLAPTGRASKVFATHSGMPAYTIHRRIYRQQRFTGLDTGFKISDNLHVNTLFVVDEASMISDSYANADGTFGSGCLLADLIEYVYSGHNCHLLLIGDRAQLPPVGEEGAPALNIDTLRGYGLDVTAVDMDKVLRQSEGSGILYNATMIRRMIVRDEVTQLPRIRFSRFPDIHLVHGTEIIESLTTSYAEVGESGTMVIVRSNKSATVYNRGIRNSILWREEEISTGDRLMVVKNNYHWTECEMARMKDDGASRAEMAEVPPFLANGDIAEVVRVRGGYEVYGLRFADVEVRFPDYNDYEMSLRVILNSLASESPSLSRAETEQLYNGVLADYGDLSLKTERMKAVRNDAFFNALQVKYAYAVTCHKAQGGQWAHVYIDQGYMTDSMLSADYIRWLYTAFTRATERLYLVNWPEGQSEE